MERKQLLTRQEFIEELSEIYPPKIPGPDQTLADIMFEAGQRSVVAKLIVDQDRDIQDHREGTVKIIQTGMTSELPS